MKVGVPVWMGRVSPVLDVSGRLLVLEVDDGVEQDRHEVMLDPGEPLQRSADLAGQGLEVLICGALSEVLRSLLVDRGVRIASGVCGAVDEVVQAFLTGRLGEAAFRMPGCSPEPLRGGCQPAGRRELSGRKTE